jgi:hypothetical protein
MKKFFLSIGLFIGTALSSFGQAAPVTMDTVNTELTNLADHAETLFNTITPIVIAVVALGVLIAFIKKVKKS